MSGRQPSGNPISPTTPMLNDILAIQAIYGANNRPQRQR
jgi:hypothetical protein